MWKANKLFIAACLIVTGLNSQNLFHSTYSWEKTPKVYVPQDSEKKSDLVIVSQKRIIEVAYDTDGQAVIYETSHNIYHVNNSKAIDGVNKGYMSLGSNLEEIDLKARCITPENKVIYFNKSTVKKVDNLEGSGPYKIFAIDGVETGCDVEILFTNKKAYSMNAYYYVQGASPISTYEARLISPKNLVYETRSYNGLTTFKSDTSDSKKNHLYLIEKNIVAGEEERYASEKPNFKGFAYQLMYNTDRSSSRLYTWDIISREYFAAYFNLEKGEQKSVDKMLNKNKITKGATNEEKIKTLDVFLKNNFELSDKYDELKLEQALDTKKMSDENALKFYIGSLRTMQIPFELVITTRRDGFKFDPKLPSYLFMKEFIIYFPEIKKFVSPTSLYSRLGFPDPGVLGHEGLFIKEVSIGDISASSAKAKFIPSTNYKDSYHNTEVKINLDFAEKTASLNVTQLLQGYGAYYVQPIYRYLSAEQKEEIQKNYYLVANSEGVKNMEVSNVEEPELYVKPLTVKYNIEHNDFLENAGNKFVFKIGLVIGPQAELYKEDARKWPADVYYTHVLERKIEVNIPAGYKVTNLNDLNLEKICKVDNKEAAVFRSSYELKDNKILITVYEDYQVLEYPLADFESFRAVINAAADFNKKNLIFEKL